MNSFNNLFTCWLLPLLFGLVLEDLLDFFVDVPHEIFLGAIVQQRANKLWIGVMPPQRIDDSVGHLVDDSLTDVECLNFQLGAILCCQFLED
jgi:hypothetical protein